MNITLKYMNRRRALRLLPKRRIDAHKGNFGKILMLCGSVGYTGAAVLAAMGALRSGAGLVYLGVPNSIYEIEASKLTVPIVFPLPDCDGKLSVAAIEFIAHYLSKVDVVLIGPGIGVCDGTEGVTKYVLENFQGPVVLDADGISVMSAHKDILRDRTGQTILTPHEGEFCRFTGVDFVCDREGCAANLAGKLKCILVLKGHKTVITDGETTFLNPTGNPGMAVGGSGDVLAGIIASLIGQGMSSLDAAASGAWFHGAAGDMCAKRIGQYGMLPTDLLEVLPRLMK